MNGGTPDSAVINSVTQLMVLQGHQGATIDGRTPLAKHRYDGDAPSNVVVRGAGVVPVNRASAATAEAARCGRDVAELPTRRAAHGMLCGSPGRKNLYSPSHRGYSRWHFPSPLGCTVACRIPHETCIGPQNRLKLDGRLIAHPGAPPASLLRG